MRHLWQWLCGYLCVVLEGKQMNRFLNLCSKNGICLWKISQSAEHKICIHIGLNDFYEIKPYLKKTKTKLKIISKKGFPFWCYRHPYAKWLFIVSFVALCIYLYSFQFIWQIQIHGNSKISEYDLQRFLTEQNIAIGMKKELIDCNDLEYQMRQKFKEMGWVSVYIKHTNLCVEIKESLYEEFEPLPNEKGSAFPLVAEKDAVIYSIVTRQGKALVTKGQSVKAGDILVLGECEILDDSGLVKDTLYFRADALIYADVKRTYILSVSEIEWMSLKLANNTSDSMLSFLINQKTDMIIQKLEKDGVIILDKNVMINREEKNIGLIVELKTREQIGINVAMEEQVEYESE